MSKLLILLLVATNAYAVQPLKEGTFECETMYYGATARLVVKQHPVKPNKVMINWEGRDRILHYVPTESGALRYEGAVSKLVFIQTPSHSMVLDDNTMKPVLTYCKKVSNETNLRSSPRASHSQCDYSGIFSNSYCSDQHS